jgi:hypothetical protein
MDSVEKQIADIERELLALTGNQPPNPAQLQLYTVTSFTITDPQQIRIVFDDGIIRVTNAYVTTVGGIIHMSYHLGYLELYVGGTPPIDFTVVSLGSFSLV